MPIRTKTLLVFIGSPGDVSPERKAAVSVIAKLSENVAKGHGWRIEPVMWERDVLPSYGKDPQKIINDRLDDLRGMDLCVFMMRDRFGTPTPRAGSGTEEEYGLAVEARRRRKNPEIWVCFGAQTPGLKGARAIQQSKARAFRDHVSKRHIRMEFGTTAHFRKDFETFLSKWVSERLAKERGGLDARSGRVSGATLTAQTAMLLGDRVYRATKPVEKSGRLVAKIEVRTPADERALRALAEGYQAVPYAFGMTGGTVRVSRVEPGEEKGKAVALVTFDAPQVNGGAGFGYASDEEGRMAAVRHVLLGEPLLSKARDHTILRGDNGPKSLVAPLGVKLQDAAARLEARLRAVQALFAAGLVTEIEQLTIGAPTERGTKVTFVGRSRLEWSGETKPLRIEGIVGPKRVVQKGASGAKKASGS